MPARVQWILPFLLGWAYAATALAQSDAASSFGVLSDFGGVGILQMPSARFGPEGEISLSSGRADPYNRNAFTLQPIPWLEGVLRYSTVTNRDYGPASFSGDQKYKDRAFDIKVLLLEESAWFPQIAVGARDIAGTGLFAGEYLALSRRYYDFDFTLGLAWGYSGARGNVPNPMGWISDRFKTRVNNVGQGGTLSNQYFRGGRAALYGGVVWHTPMDGLIFKAELDGNNYQSEPQSNNQDVRSPINLGVVYRYSDTLDLVLAYERGNTLMAQLVVKGNLQKTKEIPKFDPPAYSMRVRSNGEQGTDVQEKALQEEVGFKSSENMGIWKDSLAANQKPLSEKAKTKLANQGILLRGSAMSHKQALLVVEQDRYRSASKLLGRTARAVADELPPEVEEVAVKNLEGGLETYNARLLRKDVENALLASGSPEEIGVNARLSGPEGIKHSLVADTSQSYPDARWHWSPSMRHHIGGPDNPWFYQLLLTGGSEIRFSQRLSLTGDVSLNVYNNFDSLKLDSDSKLPHVRSDIKNYMKEGKSAISRLQLDYLGNSGESTYFRYSAGLFEEMFGGLGLEYLYKPYGAPWGIGFDVNRVRQRGFTKRFDFRDYQVTTGHIDWYYRLPFYNLRLQVSAGQYLAGDKGVTVDLSRRFDSGAVVGAFATVTNVSAEQFGEGSFDKGIYVKVPLDLLSLFSSRTLIGMTWRPLTRDGGQRLEMGKRLYNLVDQAGPDTIMRDWSRVLE